MDIIPPAAPVSISLVIPVFNEQESLEPLCQAIRGVLDASGHSGEILLVDDGSTDGSWPTIVRLASIYPNIRGVRFRRNFGKAAALAAGFASATGSIVFTMDADLQDDPEEIPRFLARLEQGYDVVSGWKRVRHDPWHKRWPSRFFNATVSRMTGVQLHDHNCGFKVYRREVVGELKLYGELHRFVPVLAAARGWRVGEMEVRHHPRRFGHSKYGFTRLVKGFLDLATVYLLTGYARRPLHLMGTVGLLAFVFGLLVLLVLTLGWVITRIMPGAEPLHLHQRALFFYAITSILLGAQLLVAGLLAELLAASRAQTEVPYTIAETCASK